METKVIAKRKIEWQLQEAKAMFSEVIKSAILQPQIITVHGEKKAVILSYEEFNKLSGLKQNLYELFQNSPFRNTQLELPPRLHEKMREVEL